LESVVEPVDTAEEDDALSLAASSSECSSMHSTGTRIVIGVKAAPATQQFTEDSIRLRDVLDIRMSGLPSAGSRLHHEGHCIVCKFEDLHLRFGAPRCVRGILCERCHLPHEKTSRAEMRRRNRANAARGSYQ